MQQQATERETGSLEQYGAIAQVGRFYSRPMPTDTSRPGFDWISIQIARFATVDSAFTALPTIHADGIAMIQEQWPIVELSETTLPTSLDTASRQLFIGTIRRGAESMFTTLALVQINDVVATLSGQSRWSPVTLEIAHLADMVVSLAANDEGGDVAALLPGDDLLIGGLQVRDSE